MAEKGIVGWAILATSAFSLPFKRFESRLVNFSFHFCMREKKEEDSDLLFTLSLQIIRKAIYYASYIICVSDFRNRFPSQLYEDKKKR